MPQPSLPLIVGIELLVLFAIWRFDLLAGWLNAPEADESLRHGAELVRASRALELWVGWRVTSRGLALGIVVLSVIAGEVASFWFPNWWSGVAIGVLSFVAAVWGVWILAYGLYPRLLRERFAVQVEEAIMIVGDELKAGHSVEIALARVVAQMGWPLKYEFREALLYFAAAAGLEPLEEVIALVANKPDYGSNDLHLVAVAISILRPLGGDLGELCRQMAQVIRKRRITQQQINILLTRGRSQALTLLVFAVVLNVVVLSFPYFSAQLWGTLVGRVAVTISMLMLAIGAFLVSRLLRTEV